MATDTLVDVTEMEPKKRRGRKPKNTESVDESSQIANTTSDEASEVSNAVKKSKRGRKPKFVYSTPDVAPNASQNVINNNSLSDDENIIVRLTVTDESLKDEEEARFDDEHPYAYNRDEYSNLSNITTCEKECKDHHVEIKDNTHANGMKVAYILQDFQEKNKVNEWPSNTSIACYWCCHKFDNAPYGIPVNYVGGKFHVFGCFCSLECAAAYNFKMHDQIDETWERYNLINLLYRTLDLGKQVRPAPNKLALKMFGGYMEIDEFRKAFTSNKVVNINFPPMSSLTQQIEEINEYDLNNDYRYIPLDQDRVEKYKEKIMFKRSKPLINNKNSLESAMNVKYN